MFVRERATQLNELLGLTILELDVPPEVRAAAVAEYEAVAQWLRTSWYMEGEIYPQGSIRLGTVVAPIHDGCEYDIDLVCNLFLAKDVSKRQLKRMVGAALRAFVETRPHGTIELKEGKRCWTLDYVGLPFHMDVLPAIPNDEEPTAPEAIWLTDRKMFQWQPSNPIGFANWFSARSALEHQLLLEAAAASRGIEVEDVPPETVKTQLQRATQALKRHRDLYFASDNELAPASVIVTTLAGRSYRGGGSLYEVLVDLTAHMADHVDQDANGNREITNPAWEDENFADRWNSDPDRADAFSEWIEAAHTDLTNLGDDLGTTRLLEGLEGAFGTDPAVRAGRRFARRRAQLRDTGRLSTTSTGVLSTAALAAPNPRHTFHGRSS